MIKFIIGFFFGMLLMTWVGEENRPEPIDVLDESREPKPDPNREVARYDWKTKSYEYRDSNKSSTKIIPLTRELEYVPDQSVTIENSPQYHEVPKTQYVEKDGKRYRMRTRGDGTIVLDPWK